MATDHLEIPQLVASQSDKTTTANEAWNLFDRSINQELDLDINNADATLTDTQPSDAEAKQNILITVTTTTTPLTADRTINVPADPKWWVFHQTCDADEEWSVLVQVVGGGGAAVTLPNQGTMYVYCDGTDCIELFRQDSDDTTVIEGTTGTINVDFDTDSIRTGTLTGNTTIALKNPRQGKVIMLDITGGGNTLTLPGTVTVFGGGIFQTGGRNLVNIFCDDEGAPTYVATISQ